MKRTAIMLFAVCLLASGCATTGRGYNRPMGEVQQAAIQQQYVAPPNYAAPPSPAPHVMPAGQPPAPAKKYLHIGANPVNPKRPTRPHERVLVLTEDAFVSTRDAKGKTSEGWLKAGEEVFAVPASDPRYWEVVAIKRCGNPVMNRMTGIGPIWIYNPTAQPVMQRQPVAQNLAPQAMTVYAAPTQQQVPECRERKSGWGSVIGGISGLAVGLLTRNRVIAAAASAGGALVGGYLDGGCIEPQDAMVAVGFGMGGYGLTKPRSHHQPSPSVGPASGGPAPLPPNGPGGLPGN